MMKDMTKGKIPSELIRFSIPLILGNLFQLTYNAVDSIIVGRWAGENALAAVGTANPVMNIVILGITGICIGASVLMSDFWGGPRGTAEAPGIHHADLRLLLFGCRGSPGSAAFGPGYEGTAGAGGDIRGCSGVFEDYLSRNAVYLSL